MKTTFLSILSVVFVMMFSSCGNAQNQKNQAQQEHSKVIAEHISVKEFKRKMQEMDNAQILDVRTPQEWAGGIIKGAMTMNFYENNFSEQLEELDKDAPVLVYCASGNRSKQAMNMMKQKGFKEVYNLSGGYSAWQRANN